MSATGCQFDRGPRVTSRAAARGTGCAAALIVAVTLTVSCATAPLQPGLAPGAGSVGTEPDPASELLASAVYQRLNANPIYYFRHVDVSVDHGVAHLSGYVWSTDAIYGARRIAQSVPGITGVVTTQLELERNGRSNGVSR